MATKPEKDLIDLVTTVLRMACVNIDNQADAVPDPYRRRIKSQLAEIRAKIEILEGLVE